MKESKAKNKSLAEDVNREKRLLTLQLWGFLFMVLFINIDQSFEGFQYKKHLVLGASILFSVYILFTKKIKAKKNKVINEAKVNDVKGNEKSLMSSVVNNSFNLSVYLVLIIIGMLYFLNPNYPIGKYADRFVPILVGVYFISEKPISKRHTDKYATYELTLGAILIFLGAMSLMFGI